jgi:hypothetical protein
MAHVQMGSAARQKLEAVAWHGMRPIGANYATFKLACDGIYPCLCACCHTLRAKTRHPLFTQGMAPSVSPRKRSYGS